MLRNAVAVTLLVGFAAACTTVHETTPSRSATEQLLISKAADEAAERLALDISSGAKVFVDSTSFEGIDHKYALGAITDQLLRRGAHLVPDKGNAEVIVAARAGALSIDRSEFLFGIPSFQIPIPLAGPLKTPEFALFKKDHRQGIAKFALTAYNLKDGSLTDSSGPMFGYSHRTKWVVLLFVSWTTDDLIPDDQEP